VETLRAAIQYIKQLQKILGIENQHDYTGKESQEEGRNKLSASPGDSEQDKLSEENFAKYLDEEERLSATPSSREDHSSTPSIENEDSLTSSLSPQIKLEVPSPSEFLEIAENSLTHHRQRSPSNYHLKGKIFCSTSQASLNPQEPKWKQRLPACSRDTIAHNPAYKQFNAPDIMQDVHKTFPDVLASQERPDNLNYQSYNQMAKRPKPDQATTNFFQGKETGPYQELYKQHYWRSKQDKRSSSLNGISEAKALFTNTYGKFIILLKILEQNGRQIC